MKMNLLDIVVDILNDMNADPVNSIDDTWEAQQVAQIVKSTYFALMSNRDWPHLKKGISLEASGRDDLPTHMKLSDEVKKLILINYNKVRAGENKRVYEPVKWIEPDDFLRTTNRRDSTQPQVDIITDPSGIELLIRNDVPPTYYTTFDDSHVVFDSYDKSVDDTLQESKVQAQGYVIPEWRTTDEFIPSLPDEAFTLLLEEAKSRASLKINQQQDIKAEQEAGRQNRWLARNAFRVKGGVKYPNYGRNAGRYRKDPTFNR